MSDSTWCTVSPTSGDASVKSITITVVTNDTYDDRNCTVTISAGGLSKAIAVSQSQQNAIILSEKTLDVSSESQTLEVELQTNVEFEVIIPKEAQGWVLKTDTRALKPEVLTLSITENQSSAIRTSQVYIRDKSSALEDTLTITQEGRGLVYTVKVMGALGEMLNQTQKDTNITMIVRGEINKTDFDVMKLQMPLLRYIDLSDVECEDNKIQDEAFGSFNYNQSNKDITKIVLPKSITSIGNMALAGCKGLTDSLILPDGVTIIGENAFNGCFGFTGTLILPEGLF